MIHCACRCLRWYTIPYVHDTSEVTELTSDSLSGTRWQGPKGRLMDRMNESTPPGAGARSVQDYAGSIKAELRVTSVAREGPIQGRAAAFGMGAMRRQSVRRFVSEQ